MGAMSDMAMDLNDYDWDAYLANDRTLSDPEVVQVERGGQVTYHGPGQVVGYPLLDLRRRGYFVKEYVHRIEEAVIRTLAPTIDPAALGYPVTALCTLEIRQRRDTGGVVDAVDHLDADVTSIEASRSRMDVLPAVAEHGFERQLGPGVWDIHSPRVPSTEECAELLERAVDALGVERLWANPDCGLKTRGYAETQESLRHLVEAARRVRMAHGA